MYRPARVVALEDESVVALQRVEFSPLLDYIPGMVIGVSGENATAIRAEGSPDGNLLRLLSICVVTLGGGSQINVKDLLTGVSHDAYPRSDILGAVEPGEYNRLVQLGLLRAKDEYPVLFEGLPLSFRRVEGSEPSSGQRLILESIGGPFGLHVCGTTYVPDRPESLGWLHYDYWTARVFRDRYWRQLQGIRGVLSCFQGSEYCIPASVS